MDAGARVALAELAPSVVRFTRSLIGHVQMRSLQPLAALLLRGQAAFEGAADDRGTRGRKGAAPVRMVSSILAGGVGDVGAGREEELGRHRLGLALEPGGEAVVFDGSIQH